MLCGFSFRFNSLRDVMAVMCCKRSYEAGAASAFPPIAAKKRTSRETSDVVMTVVAGLPG